jgi:hypothetical protein
VDSRLTIYIYLLFFGPERHLFPFPEERLISDELQDIDLLSKSKEVL